MNAIPDEDAWNWLCCNIPFVECPDSGIQETYYFRWWVYRKHIKCTPDGFVITEFLPEVQHADKHNTINCPVGHQVYEGRWIKNPEYLDDYCRYMLQAGNLYQYSCWFADAIYQRHCVNHDCAYVSDLLDGLLDYYRKWEGKECEGLFHYTPWMDGMEYSISGNNEDRFRPTLNSYMYGDALAISRLAALVGKRSLECEFQQKASAIKSNVQEKLWSSALEFFATRDLDGNFTPVGNPVREAVGYVPWYFNLPDQGSESAWRHINDPQGFNTHVGLTTAEIRHAMFLKVNPDRLASWDGAIWPFSTSQVLTAMQNVIRNCDQSYVNKSNYIRELAKYAASHLRDNNPSISEVVRDPYVAQMCGSEHYNHSTFCDLVITGVAGIIPREDDLLEVWPLLPADWDYFCLDGLHYGSHLISIVWDRTGERYGKQGFHVYIDKESRYSSASIDHVKIELPPAK